MIDNKLNTNSNKEKIQLPSELKLAEKYNTSRVTVREALRSLENENKIIRKHGEGTFINQSFNKFTSGIEQLNSLTEIIKQRGYKPGTIVWDLKVQNFNEELPNKTTFQSSNLLNIKNSKIIKLKRTRTANNIPIVYCKDYIIKKYLKNHEITMNAFENSLFNLLEKNNVYIKKAISSIIPVRANQSLEKHLNINDEMLLLLKQKHFDLNNNFILYSENFFRHEKFEFRIIRKQL